MSRKIFRTAVCACLAGAMLTVPAFAETATVTGSGVNLRSGPGRSYRVLEVLEQGTELNVTGRSEHGWFAVEWRGGTGFVSSDYLNIAEEDFSGDLILFDDDSSYKSSTAVSSSTSSGSSSAGSDVIILPSSATLPDESSGTAPSQKDTAVTPKPASDSSNGCINAMYVRFRSGPGSGYAVITEYNTGKPLTAIGTVGDWTACTIDGRSGYVFSQYVTLKDQTPAPQEKPETKEKDSGSDDIIILADKPTPTPAPSAKSEAENKGTDIILDDNSGDTVTAVSKTPEPEAPVQGSAGRISGNYVRFRKGPGTGFPIIDSYNSGKAVTVTGTTGDWTACTIDGESGYVFSQYVVLDAPQAQEEKKDEAPAPSAAPQPSAAPDAAGDIIITDSISAPGTVSTEARPGYISGNNVRMRALPSMQSQILGELFFGNAITITGTAGDWTACTYGDTAGYVYSTYVKDGSYTYNTTSSEGSAKGKEIAQYAMQFVGYNYTWGGASPDTGFDCSGLVYYVYSHFGYRLNRVASDQAMNGVGVNDLEPGDVLCFYTSGSYIGHAGIYIGDGKFVHAANSATGVVVSDLTGYYASRGYEARRIV